MFKRMDISVNTGWMFGVLTEKYHFWHLYTTNPEIYFIFLNEKNLKRTMKRKAGWMRMERKARRDSLSSEKKRERFLWH